LNVIFFKIYNCLKRLSPMSLRYNIYWLLAKEILQDESAMKYEIDDFETKVADVEEEL